MILRELLFSLSQAVLAQRKKRTPVIPCSDFVHMGEDYSSILDMMIL